MQFISSAHVDETGAANQLKDVSPSVLLLHVKLIKENQRDHKNGHDFAGITEIYLGNADHLRWLVEIKQRLMEG